MKWPLISNKQRWREIIRQRRIVLQQLESQNDTAASWQPFADHLKSNIPPIQQPLSQLQFLAIDLEMNGLDANTGEIISFGWVAIDKDGIQLSSSQHHIIEAVQGVGNSAIIHGIRDCDRQQGIRLEQALRLLFSDLTGRWPIFHHGQLDLAFLNKACLRLWNNPWPTIYFDTLTWQKIRLEKKQQAIGHGQLQLQNLLNHFQLPIRNAHNALDDAQSCAEAFLALSHTSSSSVGEVVQFHLT